jgi:hypothetical protein
MSLHPSLVTLAAVVTGFVRRSYSPRTDGGVWRRQPTRRQQPWRRRSPGAHPGQRSVPAASGAAPNTVDIAPPHQLDRPTRSRLWSASIRTLRVGGGGPRLAPLAWAFIGDRSAGHILRGRWRDAGLVVLTGRTRKSRKALPPPAADAGSLTTNRPGGPAMPRRQPATAVFSNLPSSPAWERHLDPPVHLCRMRAERSRVTRKTCP